MRWGPQLTMRWGRGVIYFNVMANMDVMRWLHDWDMNMLQMVYVYL